MSKNKTVRKGFLSKILFLLALFIVVCVPASFAAVASCSGVTDSQTRYGTISGTCYAYYCSSGTLNKLGSVSSSYCASCSGVKYAPSGTCGTCEYKCCSDGSWSGCNQECPDPSAACSSSQCWNGAKCVDKPSTSSKQYDGKCYYYCTSYTCNKGSGWSCSGKHYIKTQLGTWTYWGDQISTYSKPSTTCNLSTKNYVSGGGSDAKQACVVEAAAATGTPQGTTTITRSCQVVGNCWCVNNDGSLGSDVYCSTGNYKCQVRALSCTEKSCS